MAEQRKRTLARKKETLAYVVHFRVSRQNIILGNTLRIISKVNCQLQDSWRLEFGHDNSIRSFRCLSDCRDDAFHFFFAAQQCEPCTRRCGLEVQKALQTAPKVRMHIKVGFIYAEDAW
jgi:hypothetical protein